MSAKTTTSKRGRTTRKERDEAHAKAISPNPFLALLPTVRKDIDARLHGLLDAKLDAAKEHGSEVIDVVAAVRSLCMRGGKRLRPALLVTGFRSVNTDAKLDPALEAGVALELLQAYFLIHDDWMDQDDMRRGGPSVHAYLAKRFGSKRLGDSSAILAGDYSVALATEALARVEMPKARAQRIFSCFAQMQIDAVIGQQLDLVGHARDVEATYRLKTGSYTVQGPLRIGALLAGGAPRTLTALERFALPMGVAFQLRDDLLNAFGDPAQTGKPIGSDLKSGKRTVLLNIALTRLKGADHRLVSKLIGNQRATVAELKKAMGLLERCGARERVEARIEELVGTALSALRAGRITPQGAELLEGAARALAARRS
jgi:geranylgeranyl diphosphate synthase type I